MKSCALKRISNRDIATLAAFKNAMPGYGPRRSDNTVPHPGHCPRRGIKVDLDLFNTSAKKTQPLQLLRQAPIISRSDAAGGIRRDERISPLGVIDQKT